MRTHDGNRIAKILALGVALLFSFGTVFVITAGDSVAGSDKKTERLWRSKCGSCHGKDGKGQTKKGKEMQLPSMATAAWQKGITDAKIRETILNGVKKEENGVKKKMNPWKGKLTPAKVDSLVKHVRTFAP